MKRAAKTLLKYNKDLFIFDRSFLINLPERKDRLENSLNELKKINIIPEIYYGSRPTEKGGYEYEYVRGIAESHLNVIRLAKDRKYDQVLIFEDDVSFIDGAFDYLTKVVNEANSINEKWIFLSFGYLVRHGPQDVIGNYLKRFGVMWGAHMYGLKKEAYDQVLNYAERKKEPFDVLISNAIPYDLKLCPRRSFVFQSHKCPKCR